MTRIKLCHPEVNDGEEVTLDVEMTAIYCSPPNRAGVRRMDDIDITVPLKSEEHRRLNEFQKAICGPSGIVPIRLATGDHLGMWSVRMYRFIGTTRGILCASQAQQMPAESPGSPSR